MHPKQEPEINKLFLAIAVAVSSGQAIAQSSAEAEMIGYHQLCNQGDRKACVKFGILIGRNQQRSADWHKAHADWFWFER